MRIGDEVTYDGRRYAVVGFTPFSVQPFRIQLEDEETGEAMWLAWPPADQLERAALRVVSDANADAGP
jgi:hypothetical protein